LLPIDNHFYVINASNLEEYAKKAEAMHFWLLDHEFKESTSSVSHARTLAENYLSGKLS
jgi:hypothetical protein